MLRTLKPGCSSAPRSASNCRTCAPNPPIAPSSIVRSSSWWRARRKNQICIERLGKTRISDRGRYALRGEQIGCLDAFAKAGAERKQRDGVALPYDAAAADLQRQAAIGKRDTDAVAARIAQRRRTVVDRRRGRHHVHEFGLVRRRHDDESRAGNRDRRGRTSRHGSGRRRRPGRRGPRMKRTGRRWIATSCTTWS